MARTTQVMVHGVMTDVIQMDLPADELEEALRAQIAADEAEEDAAAAEVARVAAEEAARQAVGAVAGVASFNGRSGAVVPQAGDYTAPMVGAPALGPDGKVDPSQLPAEIYSKAVMLASGWADNTYSFEAVYPHAEYNISIEVAPTATAEQFEAFGAAMICGSHNSNVATALGDVPAMDIPIIVKVVAK